VLGGHARVLALGGHARVLALGGHARVLALGGHARVLALGGHARVLALGGHPWVLALGGHPGCWCSHPLERVEPRARKASDYMSVGHCRVCDSDDEYKDAMHASSCRVRSACYCNWAQSRRASIAGRPSNDTYEV